MCCLELTVNWFTYVSHSSLRVLSGWKWHFTMFWFLCFSTDLLFTSRAPRSLPHCSFSSPCSWTSSRTRSAPCRMPWKAWWPESLCRDTPQKPSKRWGLFTPYSQPNAELLIEKSFHRALALQRVVGTHLNKGGADLYRASCSSEMSALKQSQACKWLGFELV